MSNWTIEDQETGETWEKESRKEAEDAIEMFGDESDLELLEPGESAADEAATDGGTTATAPVEHEAPNEGEDDAAHPQGPPARTTDEMGTAEEVRGDVGDVDGAVQLQGDGSIPLEDPLSMLPGWMITEVSYNDRGDNSTTVNKRGCQVIAEFLGLDMVDRNIIKRAHETDFEYATYEITMRKTDSREFTGVGTARATKADQGEDAGWKLDMMAETRAYKRAVKSATGGGIEAFAKEGDN